MAEWKAVPGADPWSVVRQEEQAQAEDIPSGEPVFEPGHGEGCSLVKVGWGGNRTEVHICARPIGHGGSLHRCAQGCEWETPEKPRFLIWSLSKKKWMAPDFSGYVDAVKTADAGRFEWSDVRRCCAQETTPMRTWRPVPLWPGHGRALPAIYLTEMQVSEELETGARTLDGLIRQAAMKQVPGWSEYWEEVGEVYQTTLTRPADAQGRGYQLWEA